MKLPSKTTVMIKIAECSEFARYAMPIESWLALRVGLRPFFQSIGSASSVVSGINGILTSTKKLSVERSAFEQHFVQR